MVSNRKPAKNRLRDKPAPKTKQEDRLDEAELEELLNEEMKDEFEVHSDDDQNDNFQKNSQDLNLQEFDEDELLSNDDGEEKDNDVKLTSIPLEKEDEGEDSDNEYLAYLQMKKKNFKETVLLKDKLIEKLNEFKLGGGKEVPWTDTLSVTNSKPIIEDIHDDFKREASFHAQAFSSVLTAHQNFADLNFSYKRPEDYFAEMIKTDEHMSKIRKRLLEQQKGIEENEARRKQRDLKKFGKQVQTEKVREREKKKKESFDAIKKWRKQRQRGGADDKIPFEEEEPSHENNKKSNARGKPSPNQDRKRRDEQFGFGGKKRNSKSNDSKSFVSDMYPKKNINKGNRNSNDGKRNSNDGKRNSNNGKKNFNNGKKNFNKGFQKGRPGKAVRRKNWGK